MGNGTICSGPRASLQTGLGFARPDCARKQDRRRVADQVLHLGPGEHAQFETEGTLMNRPLAKAAAQASSRRIVHRTRGNSHGPITRLVSPSDVGELIKPFVFLDYFEIDPKHTPPIGFHPHSGIATLSLIFEGQIAYEETSGAKGVIEPGGVEWMRAGGGVWHTGGAVGTASVKGYQLWVALPPEMESMESKGQYLGRERFRSHGPARVILGRLGEASSTVPAPATMNYLDV